MKKILLVIVIILFACVLTIFPIMIQSDPVDNKQALSVHAKEIQVNDEQEEEKEFCIVTAYVLNLRSNPGASILQWIPKKTRLEVVDQEGNWLHVKTPDRKAGYVYAEFCEIEEDISTK